MSKGVCIACFTSSPGSFCGNCGGKCLPADSCSKCGARGDGAFCGECGAKRLAGMSTASDRPAGGASVESGLRPSEVFAPPKKQYSITSEITEDAQPQMVAPTDDWHIWLVNLPAVPGQPFELYVGKNLVYRNEGTDCRVNHKFVTPTVGWGQANEFQIKIPVVQFNLQRNFKMDEGKYIRLMADNAGKFTVRRQKFPF